MAIYISVAATATIVSALALTAMSVARLERKQAVAVNNRLAARCNARSGVELALRLLANNANWRSTYVNGVETTARTLGANGLGTVSWKLSDSDGNLANADSKLILKGIGRAGASLQVHSLEIRAGIAGPTLLRSLTSASSLSDDTVKDNKWWCQYLQMNLPADANGWRISSVEIFCRRENAGQVLNLLIYRGAPISANIVDSTSLVSTGIPTSFTWYSMALSGAYWLNRGDAVCVSLESPSNNPPIRIRYASGGVSEANSGLIKGDPDWETYDADKALLYRIHGYYTTSSGVRPVAATGVWDTP
ncbi:MAG: hypothetical protein DCC67_10765 [Planctomycetota bacterium]|nr:MAG: hypothetical protein DCC67_10765 [Planctomycetota bacterium]